LADDRPLLADDRPLRADDRPLRADARRNREQLLSVARTAFAEEGLSVPLDEIARRAGVGPGTLYRHFPTKEALFEAILHDRLRQIQEDARARGASADPGEALFGFIDRLVAEARPKQDLIEALATAGVNLSPSMAATGAGIRDEIGHLLDRAQRSGAVRPDITVEDVMALLSGLLFALRPRARHQADAGRLLAVLRAGLRGSAAYGPGSGRPSRRLQVAACGRVMFPCEGKVGRGAGAGASSRRFVAAVRPGGGVGQGMAGDQLRGARRAVG
jgi:AcrR family transcriptional regulator